MKIVAVAFLILGMLCSSISAPAQGPVPFKKLMQNAGVQPAIPPKPHAKDASNQSTESKHAKSGKAERVTGAVLFGAGVATIATTLAVVGVVHGSAGHPGRVWAGVGGGAGMAGVGVTLIVLGNHKRPSN